MRSKQKNGLKKSKKEYIETYIFTPHLLTKEMQLEVEQWLEVDEELKAIADWYIALKKEIRFVEKGKAKSRPAHSAIELFPSVKESRKKHTFTLAAKSPDVKKRRAGFDTLRTFISEENKALVRVLRNHENEDVQIHAISENIESDDIAMLRVPGGTDLMISRPGGIFYLEGGQVTDNDVKEWDSCTLFISMDRADLLLNRETNAVYLDTHRTDKEKLSLTVTEEELQIKVSMITNGETDIDKVVISDGENGYLLLAVNDAVYIPRSVMKNRVTSLFFFN